MATNNNGDMDTTLAHDLQPWLFPSQTMAANPSSSAWNIFSVPNSGNAFSFMISEPQTRNEAAAYISLLNHGREESSQQSRESVEQDKDSRQRHGLASEESGEEDEQRPGKRHQAKNLVAERKRREKIRDGLHALRAIVPKITKMDKASILGDAIEYVKELQQQVKDLQDQLEEDNGKSPPELTPSEPMNQGMDSCDPLVRDDEEKQQMEPQVEVKQLVANELFLMVLCEHKRGGFARLMEAMNGIGLQVTNASVTTFRSLVLHVFRVEGRDNTMVQAEEVRNSLLEMTRSSNKALLTNDANDVEDSSVGEYHHHRHQEQQQQHYHHHHHRGNRRRCHNSAPSPPTWP